MALQAKELDAFVAGRQLGVEFILHGIIRRLGNKIRVTAQLLNVAEGSTRWSASFAEDFVDVLQLEDSLSEQVTKQLIPQLSGEEREQIARRGTNIPEAHDAYLKGRYFWNQFTPATLAKAFSEFDRALELDPEYALAYVGISDYYTWACIYGLVPPAEGFPRVLDAATKALEIDPALAEAHAAVGLYHSNMQAWPQAESGYRQSISLNPNYPLAHEWLSALLVGTGQFEEGTREIIIAEQLDPLGLRPKVLSAWTLDQARKDQLALEKASELGRLSPDFMQTHLQTANILLETGDFEKALEHARRAVELETDSQLPIYVLCFALVRAGLGEEADELLSKWTRAAETAYISPYFLAMCNVALDNKDRAIDLLELARQEHNAWVLWLATEPKLDSLREHPAFIELLGRAGLPSLQH
jgi:tetratricopeptide (TPR) repeat protein